MDDLELLDHFYNDYGYCPNVHLKFDTGMTRLGFDDNDSDKVFSFLLDRDHLPVIGIYSHFATADEGDLSYAESQLLKFKKIVVDQILLVMIPFIVSSLRKILKV